jgi:hypothetical protein
MERARSNYRQLQVTVTLERGGWLTARVLAKPLGAEWSYKQVVWHQRWQPDVPMDHWVTALMEATATIAEQPTLAPSPPGAPWPTGAPLGGLRGVPAADDTLPPESQDAP